MAGPMNTPDKKSGGILRHTLCVVISASMKRLPNHLTIHRQMLSHPIDDHDRIGLAELVVIFVLLTDWGGV
jgi:hypothetical protein